MQHVQAGKLRPPAVTASKRTSMLPAVPTLAEADVPGADVYEWNALFTPSYTPEPVLEKLSQALQAAMDSPE